MNRPRTWWVEILLPVLAATAAFGVALYYGPIGYMPLDHSIVFDGGWRILSGQVPFRDFGMPNGLPQLILQAGFFAIFGVNWEAYVLHAAVSNAAFAATAYCLLRVLGGGRPIALFYAVLSGLIFYPPIGIPYLESHGFLFGLIGFTLVAYALERPDSPAVSVAWALAPGTFLLAYLSKQIPTVFLLPVVLLWIATAPRGAYRNAWRPLAIGTLAAAAAVAAAAAWTGVSYGDVSYYISELPGGLGRERLTALLDPVYVIERLRVIVYQWSMLSLVLVQLLLLLVIAAWAEAKWGRSTLRITGVGLMLLGGAIAGLGALRPELAPSQRAAMVIAGFVTLGVGALPPVHAEIRAAAGFRTLRLLLLAEGLILTCVAFVLTANQHPVNGISYAFVATGIVHLAFAGGARSELRRGRALTRLVAAGAIPALLVVATAIDGVRFDRRVNQSRAGTGVGEIGVPIERPPQTGELAFLKAGTPEYYGTLARDFPAVVDFLRSNEGNFLLVGDASILYGLTGRPSVNPVLWYHAGLTMGAHGTEEYEIFRERLRQRLDDFDVRYLVLEGEMTWRYETVETLQLGFESCREVRIGIYTIQERCSAPAGS